MSKKRIHLVCNAHLDPVWLWNWEEGAVEALATFRVAADFCDRYPEFVFNQNEALLYRWVEELDPELFRRIQAHVAAGRWNIAGGAYVQPDINGPGGESHIRQYLAALPYFQDRFGVRLSSAYNFDSFGHAEGLPQILRACGMDSYIFCRPAVAQHALPVGCFRWEDRSGAWVCARRSDDHYQSAFNMDSQLERFTEHYRDEDVTLLLWGLGNHGGGPYRREYELILKWFDGHEQFECVHSTPEAFFREAMDTGRDWPVVRGELQNLFVGCYTSMSRVKRVFRQAEGLMATTERLAALAWWADGLSYPKAVLDDVWRDLLFCAFHDILPGSGTASVETDALALLGHGMENLRRMRLHTLLALCAGQAPACGGDIPLFFVNPHGFALETTVEIEFHVGGDVPPERRVRFELQDACSGACMPHQRIKPEHNLGAEFRVRLAIPLAFGPFQMRRLDARPVFHDTPPSPRPVVQAQALEVTTAHLRILINPATGLVDRITRTGEDRSWVAPDCFQPVLLRDMDHSWTAGDPQLPNPGVSWEQPTAPAWKDFQHAFRLATPEQIQRLSPPGKHPPADSAASPPPGEPGRPIRIIEDGPCRTVVEASFVFEDSVLVREYIIDREQAHLDILDRITMNHRNAMLKLAIPLGFRGTQSISEAPYSAATRFPTADLADQPNQRWVAVAGENLVLCALNTGSFAHSFTGDRLLLNVLRTPPYASFGLPEHDHWSRDRYAPRMDLGCHEVRYRFLFPAIFDEAAVAREAELLNMPPSGYVFFPPGDGRPGSALMQSAPPLAVSCEGVQITAVKQAECGDALIVRLLNRMADAQSFYLRVGQEVTDNLSVGPYQLITIKLVRHETGLTVRHVSAMEDPL